MKPLQILPLAAVLAAATLTAGRGQSKGKQVRLQNTAALSSMQRSQVARTLPTIARKLGRPAQRADTVDAELNLMCGIEDWFIMYDEDANGNPVTGTCIIACDGVDIPFC
jgi:hypothetical protein